MDYEMIIEEAENLIDAGCEYYTVNELVKKYGYSLEDAKSIKKQMEMLAWIYENN